jgi:hypothetical protein|tara:strand:+ start:571 stop:777 length:207 start_codon:yes stop_codon:yes gene_type:complete
MKTFVFLVVLVLFLITIRCFFFKNSSCKAPELGNDKRIDKIKRAQKNLHPVINRNVDRLPNGRFVKRK